MEKVFISMNSEGHLVIKPAEEHRTQQAAEASRNAKPVSKGLSKPHILDSRGRIKLPADVRRFLSGDDDPV